MSINFFKKFIENLSNTFYTTIDFNWITIKILIFTDWNIYKIGVTIQDTNNCGLFSKIMASVVQNHTEYMPRSVSESPRST